MLSLATMQHLNSQSLVDQHEEAIEDINIPYSTVVEVAPDFPPESFWLSKDAEFDWFDQNAFLERKESTRGSFNSMSSNPSHSNTSSQRYSVSLKPKAPIIGLPKTQKTTYVDLKCRLSKPLNVRLFPKQLYSVPKTVPVTEPSSPKVSCMGRVRSKRCPNYRNKSSEQAVELAKSTSQRPQKAGMMSRIMSLFCCEGHWRKKSKSSSKNIKKPVERSGSRRKWVSVEPVNTEPGTPSEPPAFGVMTRFVSGRRSEYLGGLENDDVAGSHSMDSEMRV